MAADKKLFKKNFYRESPVMKNKIIVFLKQTALLLLGSSISAFAVKGFLVPHDFLAGGLTGTSLIIYYKFPVISVGLIYFLLNVPVFLIGWRFVGIRFILYSLWGMILYSFMLYVMTFRFEIGDKLLCALVAGAISGVGTAILLRSYGSGGGSDILCVVMNKLFSITVGKSAMIINTVVLIISVLLFPLENVLYALVYIAVCTQVTDKVFHGFANRQAALIISGSWKKIADELMERCHVGTTLIKGIGGYEKENRTIIYSVVSRKNLPLLKKTALEKDPDAFIAVMPAEDVTGVEIGNQPHW